MVTIVVECRDMFVMGIVVEDAWMKRIDFVCILELVLMVVRDYFQMMLFSLLVGLMLGGLNFGTLLLLSWEELKRS